MNIPQLLAAICVAIFSGDQPVDAAVTGYNQTVMFEYNPTYTSQLTSFQCNEDACADIPECQLNDPAFLAACASKLDPGVHLTKRVRWNLNRGELWEGNVRGQATGHFEVWCTAINLGFLPELFDPAVITSDIFMTGLESNCTTEQLQKNPHRAVFLSRNYWYNHNWPGACTSGTEIHPIWWDPTALDTIKGTFTFRRSWIRWDMALQIFYSIAETGVTPCQLGISDTSSVYLYTEHVVLAETVSTTSTTTTTRPRGRDVRDYTGPGWENRKDGDVFHDDGHVSIRLGLYTIGLLAVLVFHVFTR